MLKINFGNTSSLTPAADIRMHPIIDKNSNDPSCIYSTLPYVSKQCEILRIPTACMTYDHSLWLMAVDIIASQQLCIVCRLGLFHMIMSSLHNIILNLVITCSNSIIFTVSLTQKRILFE